MGLPRWAVGSTVRHEFTIEDADGNPLTPTDLGTLRAYKDGSATERTSTNGMTLAVFDSVTATYQLTIDLTDDTDSGFWVAGRYSIMSFEMIANSVTKSPIIYQFEIGGAFAESSEIADLDTVVDGVASDVTGVASDVTSLSADVATVNGTVDALAVSIGNLNDLSASDVKAQADQALADYNGPTRTESLLDKNEILSEISGQNDLSEAQVNAQVDTALAEAGVTSVRMGYVDKLNVSGTLAHSDAANTYKATGFSTHSAANAATAVRSELSTELGRIDVNASSRSSHSAADVWTSPTRTLSAFGFSVTVSTNNDKTGYSVDTVNDKTGYSVDTVNDKTGYSLSSAAITAIQSGLLTLANFVRYVALMLRSDAGIATDLSSELGQINQDFGTGAGDYSNQTEAQEAIRDRGDSAWSGGGGGGGLTGPFALSISVDDGTNPLQNVSVRVYEGADTETQLSDANGDVPDYSVADATTYSVIAEKFGYGSYSGSVTISGANASLSISLTQIAISVPDDPTRTTGYFAAMNDSGPVVGVVFHVRQTRAASGDGIAMSTEWVSATSQAVTGLVEFTHFVPGAIYQIRAANDRTEPFEFAATGTGGGSFMIPDFLYRV